ncbi:alpha/beta fold hydrolase [Entomomonas asaccharolytica]|uniref:Alpha/beta hydrolase n=1 Tax=Entomomonas asaccharolytica TaxID=2785331 RepID=A0A974NH23_9GAMM|nr:alpha/beta hydrolase [Entomomonas asaccharolytica]QQP86591.1 alpha/beta hydrolase [Entomomonas asaccharolytica]
MFDAKEVRIQLPHVELAGLEYGDPQGEPVLALHGWLDNAMSFVRLNPKLKGMRIIAIDLMGHGFSQHKPAGTGYQLWEAVFSTVAVIHKLGWQRCSLLGHSLGAIISVMTAAIRPDLVKQLMLIDGLVAYSKQPTEFPQQLQHAMLGFAKSLSQPQTVKVYDCIDTMIQRRQKGLVPISYEAASLLMERGAKAVAGGYSWRSDSQLMIPSPFPLTDDAAWSYAEQITCPTHLILAKQGLLIENKHFMQRLAQLNTCKVEVLEGGHHLHLDTEQSAQEVADYFNDCFLI